MPEQNSCKIVVLPVLIPVVFGRRWGDTILNCAVASILLN
jgi:hypothetical protein